MVSHRAIVLFICVLSASANNVVNKDGTDNTSAATKENYSDDKVKSIVTGSVVTKVGDPASNNTSNIAGDFFEKTIYNAVLARDFKTAISQSVVLYGRGYLDLIRNVVRRLIIDGRTEIFDFAYQLTQYKAAYIIKVCFPTEIRMLEDMVFVKIVSNRYNFALKYSYDEDWSGDRTVFGDPNTKMRFDIMWKFLPSWEGDRVYFHLRPIHLAIFMKSGNSRDSDDDHGVYGSKNRDSDRHLWYVKPVTYDGKLLFYIINKEFNEPLKLGKSVDWDGDRQAYCNSNLDLNPEKYAWAIEVL